MRKFGPKYPHGSALAPGNGDMKRKLGHGELKKVLP